MKKLIVIASIFISLFSASAGMKTLSEQPPEAGSAAEFVINFIKTAPKMGLEEAKKHATKVLKVTVSQRALDEYATVDFEQPFKWIEIQKPNGFVRVQVRYTYAKGSKSMGQELKKIDGKWMFASKNADKDK